MSNFASISMILDTRRAKKDGDFPVKLRVTHDRRHKYYTTGISVSESDYQKILASKTRGELKETKIYLNSIEKKASNIVKDMPDFSFQNFEKLFLKKKNELNDIFSAYDNYIGKLQKEGRIRTSQSYECSMNSLKSFSEKLRFDQITSEFLRSYEKWMIAKGRSITTIGIYLRCLKALINEAIREGKLRQELYPFGKHKYQIPAGKNIKKALTISDIEKIFSYSPISGTTKEMAKDYWIFSYLCNGVNIKDIALLKYKNIDGDKIVFIRSKTEHTTRQKLKPIVAIVTPEAKNIMKRWGNKPKNNESYIFPILSNGLSPEQEIKKIKQTIKTINKYIRKIATEVGIEKDITTYTARHSFSTVLKRSGAPIEFISESLGHQNMATTENYLDSFEDDTKKKYADLLTKFGG